MRLEHHNFVIASHIEHYPGTFFQHVRVKVVGTQQKDAMFQRLTLGGDLGQLQLGFQDLIFQPHPGQHAAITFHRVVGEIGHSPDPDQGADYMA